MTFGAVSKYGNVVQMGGVTSFWMGREEESYTITLKAWSWSLEDYPFQGLRSKLAEAATRFRQKSIALTIAEPLFITAAE
jgi:hypothetical protein